MVSQVWFMNVIHAIAFIGEVELNAIGSFLDFRDIGAWTCSSTLWHLQLSSRTWVIPYDLGSYRVNLL